MRIVSRILIVAVVLGGFSGAAVHAQDQTAKAIATVKSIGSEARNGASAVSALKTLNKAPASDLIRIVAAIDDANPVAANFLRGAAEAVAAAEIARGGQLPVDRLEAFVKDTKHAPLSREVAFDLLSSVDSTAADRLIPGMANDPSVEFRRAAVARLLESAEKLLADQKLDDAKAQFEKALASARDLDQVEKCAEELKKLGVSVDLRKHFGLLTNWKLIGPFDNTDKKGLEAVYEPEKELKFDAVYQGKEGEVKWVDYQGEDPFGIIDLNNAVKKYMGAVVYATTTFKSASAQTVELRLGTPNAYKVWVNGKLIFGRSEYHRGEQLDQYRMPVELKAGENTILLKICQNEQTETWAQKWQFQIRVCDSVGTAILPSDGVAAVVQEQAGQGN
jgi:hypothetical protein